MTLFLIIALTAANLIVHERRRYLARKRRRQEAEQSAAVAAAAIAASDAQVALADERTAQDGKSVSSRMREGGEKEEEEEEEQKTHSQRYPPVAAGALFTAPLFQQFGTFDLFRGPPTQSDVTYGTDALTASVVSDGSESPEEPVSRVLYIDLMEEDFMSRDRTETMPLKAAVRWLRRCTGRLSNSKEEEETVATKELLRKVEAACAAASADPHCTGGKRSKKRAARALLADGGSNRYLEPRHYPLGVPFRASKGHGDTLALGIGLATIIIGVARLLKAGLALL